MDLPGTVVLIPRRSGDPHRDALWRDVRRQWVDHGWRVHEGHHDPDEGPFNRSAAINRAAESAGPWGLAVIADADTLCPVDQVIAACIRAHAGGCLVFAHDRFVALDEAASDDVRAGNVTPQDVDPAHWLHEMAGTCSSCLVIPRGLWDAVGGFDEGFASWGHEDQAFSIAARTIGPDNDRVPGTVWHLFHNPAEGCAEADHPLTRANRERAALYEACDGDREAMRELLARC